MGGALIARVRGGRLHVLRGVVAAGPVVARLAPAPPEETLEQAHYSPSPPESSPPSPSAGSSPSPSASSPSGASSPSPTSSASSSSSGSGSSSTRGGLSVATVNSSGSST